MNTQFIRDEVERRVAELLPGVLLDKGVLTHAKRSFRLGCVCDYCTLKREATSVIGSAGFGRHTDYFSRLHQDKEVRRASLRATYRKRLKYSLQEVS
jgi:hypothetical protein